MNIQEEKRRLDQIEQLAKGNKALLFLLYRQELYGQGSGIFIKIHRHYCKVCKEIKKRLDKLLTK